MPKQIVSDDQLSTLQARLESLHAAQLLTDDELYALEDVCADHMALGTVTAIIDGTGSLGAAVGPPLAGWISSTYSWGDVFMLLYLAVGCAAILLSRVVIAETCRSRGRRSRQSDTSPLLGESSNED